MINHKANITNVGDLERFSACIKQAVVTRIQLDEKFSAIRLTNASLRYSDWIHPSLRGQARHADNEMVVTQRESALQLAGTVVHELAHMLIGPEPQQHGPHWTAAAVALGMTRALPAGQMYEISDFTPDIARAITDAIERFAHDNPALIYDDALAIPWPPHVGDPTCEGYTQDNGCAAHKVHIMQFQLDGIRWMLRNGRNILLADEMGLGKTVEVMGYINVAKPESILVVCPNNAKLIWKRHLEQFCVHPFDVELAYTKLYTFGDYVIMNYEAAVKWAAALKTRRWGLVIFDEGHYLKNPSAKRSEACYAISGDKSIIITGTPIVNYPYELFPLIHYLDRENWPTYASFEATYGARGNTKFGRNLPRLNSILRSTIMLRRIKKDVLTELPKKRRQVVEFEVDDATRALIEEEKKLFQTWQGGPDSKAVALINAIKNEGDVAGDDLDWQSIIEELTQTRRYAFEEMAKIAHRIARAKLSMIYEHIENALEAREKVIVFGHHRDVLTAIADRFKPNSVLLLGGTGDQASATQQASDRFNNDDDCRLFVAGVSLAQGYSLQGSSTVIFVEEDWVPGIMTQAEDRAHGIGRGETGAKSMLIQHLVFEDSLDTYKAKLTIKKQKSIDKAVNK